MTAGIARHVACFPNVLIRRLRAETIHLLAAATILFGTCQISAALSEPSSNELEAAAYSRLGQLILDGKLLEYDPSKAVDYLSKAAELGDRTARLKLAEMSIRGIGMDRDIERSLAEIKLIASEGSLSALVSLGDIYAHGYSGVIDLEAAMVTYEKAAAAGSVEAALRLSEIFRYGLFGETDKRRAYAYLNRARELGNSYAIYLMGDGLVDGDFKRIGRPAMGLKLIRHADKLGVSDAGIALAMRSDNRSAKLLPRKKIISNLTKMADAGNIDAALRLFDLYLDPKYSRFRRLSSRDISKARARLNAVAKQLKPGELEYRSLLLDIVSAKPREYASLYQRISFVPPRNRPSLMRRTLRSNPNAFFYFVQKHLAENGFFRGRMDGRLRRRTISAIKAYCRSLGVATLCRRGPLSVQTTHVLIYSF